MGRSRGGVKKRQARTSPVSRAARRLAQKNGQITIEGVEVPEGKVLSLGTETEWLAMLLHQAQAMTNELRRVLLEKEQELVNLRVDNGKKQVRVLQLEIAAQEQVMGTLREQQGIALGVTINKDDKTGQVYYIEDAPNLNAESEEVPAEKPDPVEPDPVDGETPVEALAETASE